MTLIFKTFYKKIQILLWRDINTDGRQRVLEMLMRTECLIKDMRMRGEYSGPIGVT